MLDVRRAAAKLLFVVVVMAWRAMPLCWLYVGPINVNTHTLRNPGIFLFTTTIIPRGSHGGLTSDHVPPPSVRINLGH